MLSVRISATKFLTRPKSVKIVIKDENKDEVVSNWPNVFGPGVHMTGPKQGLPINDTVWHKGNNLTKGRATTFRTQSRWPRPEQIMPLKRVLPTPLEGDEHKAFAHQSNIDLFPDPAGVARKTEELYYTEQPKEITIEGVLQEEESTKVNPKERVCPLESRNISVTPKDVLILAQFINKDGTLRTQEQTGLCDRQFEIVREAVFIAQNDGLLPTQRFSYYENRVRWRIQVVDNMKENRTPYGTPSSPEIMNRYNANALHGAKTPNWTKGAPWYRAYVNSYSEILAENTPVGLPKERTQQVSTSVDLREVHDYHYPGYWDNNGVKARRNRLGPFNHGFVNKSQFD